MNLLVVLFNLRAPVGGETEWVEEERHVVMLGRIFDLDGHYKVSWDQEGDYDCGGGGGDKDNNDNGGGSDEDKPRRRLPQKGRMCLAVAPWSRLYYNPSS